MIRGLLLSVLMVLPLFLLTVRGATVGAPCTLDGVFRVGIIEFFHFTLSGTVVESSDGTQSCAPNDPNPYPFVPPLPCGSRRVPVGAFEVDSICPY